MAGDNDKEIWRLKRQLLASKERQNSYTWQIRIAIIMGALGVAILVITAFQWSFLLTPLFVIGMAAMVGCLAMAG